MVSCSVLRLIRFYLNIGRKCQRSHEEHRTPDHTWSPKRRPAPILVPPLATVGSFEIRLFLSASVLSVRSSDSSLAPLLNLTIPKLPPGSSKFKIILLAALFIFVRRSYGHRDFKWDIRLFVISSEKDLLKNF